MASGGAFLGGGVSSLNSLTGGLSILGGSGITVTPSGTNITITNTATTSPGGSTGDLQYNNAGAFGGDTTTTDGAGNLSGTTYTASGSVKTPIVNQPNSASYLAFQVGGTGIFYLEGATYAGGTAAFDSAANFIFDTANMYHFGKNAAGNIYDPIDIYTHSFVDYFEISTPTSPAVSRNETYFKSDGLLRTLTHLGAEATVLQNSAQSTVTSSTTMALGNVYPIDSTSGVFNLTFPAPVKNSEVTIVDLTGQTATNTVTVLQNASENIEGVASSYLLQAAYASWTFVSLDGTNWVLK